MDGELLWNTLYRAIAQAAAWWEGPVPRRGHPDEYATWEIAACWLWSALRDQPLVTATLQLQSGRFRRAMRLLGFILPPRCPHETTLRRRAGRLDFLLFLHGVNAALIKQLQIERRRLLIDSTPLPVSQVSKDREATWGHHRQRGYRWHTLVSRNRVILQMQVESANVHELSVAPTLVRRAARQRLRPLSVVGDQGYDSERLHQSVDRHLHARMIAPLNDRGGSRAMRRTPHRALLNEQWNRPAVQAAFNHRPEVDRMYSVLKSRRFGLFALPPWVRHRHAVRRWVKLKMLLYHADLVSRRKPKLE